MSIISAMASHLKAETDIAAHVGSQIYQVVAADNAVLPYVTIQQISDDHVRHTTAASGLASAIVQVSCLAQRIIALRDLVDKVRLAMDHFSGEMGTPPNTETVQGAFLGGSLDTYDEPRDARDVGIFGVRMTWTIWYEESIPTYT